MAESDGGKDGWVQIGRDIIALFLGRARVKVAKEAGFLAFRKGGMYDHVEKIASGEGTARVFKELRDDLSDTEQPVWKAIERLEKVRDKLGNTPIGFQIDAVLHDKYTGKLKVREELKAFVRSMPKAKADRTRQAMYLCNTIDAFNGSLRRLDRMLRDS